MPRTLLKAPRALLPALATGLLLLGAAACSTPDARARGADSRLTGKLVLTGSSTVAPLASEIARRFEERYPGTRIDVQTGGSSRGIADTRSGAADIGMASRALSEDELDLTAHTLARDGICLIVHAENSVSSLDESQVVAIFTGEISDWSQVGGTPGPITVVHKAAGRATREVFLDHFDLEPEAVEPDVVIGDNQQGLKTIAGNPGAIAYVSIGAADYDARRGAPVKLLSAGVVAPTTANVAAGRFPITRPLNFLTRRAELSELEAAFLDFALSEQVHDLIEDQLFVPVAAASLAAIEERIEDRDDARPRV